MKHMKRVFSVLLACLMLMMVLPMAVSAEGTQDNPINANDKWFGYGADCYLLNPTIAEGSDGVWYTFSPEQDGILVLEHKYKDMDYDITIDWYGLPYTGGAVDGVIYNGPIMTLPVSVGDPITVHIAAKDGAAGTVYANMKIVTGTIDDPIKVKSAGLTAYVGAGQTVYFQDDTLNADYATKGLEVFSGIDTVFYNVSVSGTNGQVTEIAETDTDGDGTIEVTLFGSLGDVGAPPVKPMWAIQCNNTDSAGFQYTLTIVDEAHECNWDDDTDADCNTCGAIREVACEHAYDGVCDADCNLCGETREAPHSRIECSDVCDLCLTTGLPTTAEHEYDNIFDYDCNVCGGAREVIGVDLIGGSISEDVNGLAMQFTIPVEGMAIKGTTAIYDNATIGGYKLVGMGAVVSNYGDNYYDIEDSNGLNVIDVPVVYLCDLTENSATFAIRIINIPEEGKNTLVYFRPYFIYEDARGRQHTVYCPRFLCSYNGNECMGWI